MQVDITMVANTCHDIILLSGTRHTTYAMFGDAGRMTLPESLHEKAICFGVIQVKNHFMRVTDASGTKVCIIPFNKLVAYHNSIK